MGDTETYTRLAARPMQVQTDGSRIGTTAEWVMCATLIPAAGQECKDLTAGTVKLGDGTKSYAALSAIAGGTGTVDPVALAADPAFTGTYGPQIGSDAWLRLHAGGDLDALIVGAVTRDASGAATAAGVVWPDGVAGVYAATTVSSAFPGAVDAYIVTWVGSTTKTVTQPAVTRDASGAVTVRPAMTVA